MTTDTKSPIGQSEEIFSALSEHFKKLATYVASGGDYPQFSEIAARLNYDDLHRLSHMLSESGLSIPVGAAIDVTHHAVAMNREYSLLVKSKSEYYQSGASDHTNESSFYDDRKIFQTNTIRGKSNSGVAD